MELVEKVARAIAPLQHRDNHELLMDRAQAALAAINETHVIVPREPTEAMLEAMDREWDYGAFDVYHAMIEAGCLEESLV